MTTPLTKKEQLYQLIAAQPFISQQDLADQLGLSRSAVAGHIAALIREKRLLGRAYVLPDQRPVVCIGGANIDRKLRTLGPVQMGTSNPVSQHEAFGGVARNIAENLARLGLPTRLLCAVGDDAAGHSMLAHAQSVGIDAKASLVAGGLHSGSYTALLNDDGDMVLALAHMECCDALTPEFLTSRAPQRGNAALTIADLNLPQDSIGLLLQEAYQHDATLILVAVSEPKMARLPADLRGLRCLILNRGELGAAVGLRIEDKADIAAACRQLQTRGVRDLVVTLGGDGVMYTDAAAENGMQQLSAPPARMRDATGAGDAFAAGLAWSLCRTPDDLGLACQYGLKLARLTLESDATVSPTICPTIFEEELS
ncbi:PfkB family carbohydrate kinase [Undibacterium sp. TS12]|uniref:PfkB family carbohydrate kinase n=1 Tax=Undibacterium sp. TS12 TaxID=2908202 RepID=UPI001F4D33C2|nr:PfkB family carbohydrate kinase [Undibacterium sp. TS12]MCH8620309.1 PfkB family carbohydrate kinase [Undibacterium sp. TS12]